MIGNKQSNVSGGSEACRRFDQEVADYLDGEDRPAVLAHAKECVFCGVVLEDLGALVSESSALPVLEPPAHVWANVRAMLIAEGIIHEPESTWRRWLAPLTPLWHPAPAVALAGLVVLAITLTITREAFVPTPTNTASVRPTTYQAVAQARISGEDIALAQTVDGLERDYRSRKTSFEPGVAATYEKGLASLDDSIREARVSVEKEPDNSLAREYLLAAYQQKVEVLSAALEYDGR